MATAALMCEISPGTALVGHPIEGPGAGLASAALEAVAGRYGASRLTSLRTQLAHPAEPVWPEGPGEPTDAHQGVSLPFDVDLIGVTPGSELAFVDELRRGYLEEVLNHPNDVPLLAKEPALRLAASPNWMYTSAAGIADKVNEPFTLGPHTASYQQSLGLGWPEAGKRQVVAVLDNGFNPALLPNSDAPAGVKQGRDLIGGDAGTSGHGTLVATIVALAAPEALIEPIRMGGDRSTEFDTLHAVCRAVELGASVITLSYSQVLAGDVECDKCGVMRTSARSEVFEKLLGWAASRGPAILVATGNTGMPLVAPPASYPGAIPVTSVNVSLDARSSFANWDASGSMRMFAAPGEEVAIARSGQEISGTSFAVAYAAAVLATTLSRMPFMDVVNATHLMAKAGYPVDAAVVPRVPL
jgi:Subtilase family